MKTGIIIAIYWAVAVAATYCIRAYNNKKNRFKIAAFKALGITTAPSLWKQIGTRLEQGFHNRLHKRKPIANI